MNYELRVKNGKAKPGFTLIEITVAMFGFAMIIWGLLWMFSNIFYLSKGQDSFLSDSDQARKLAFQIATELRNGQTGSNGAYVLDTAGAEQIIFYTSNAALGPGVDRVRYFLKNGQLWKGVTQYNGTAYNTTTEATYMVQNDLANGANPIFYYYDGTYVGSSTQSSLNQPVNVTQVKFVQVKLQIYNKTGLKNTTSYSVTAGATIRNLKTNLGE